MICNTPIEQGPNKGSLARGTPAGYLRHRRAGEAPCRPCLLAQRAYINEAQKRYAAKNPNTIRQKNRRYYHANKAYFTAHQRAWRQANIVRSRAFVNARRVRRMGAEGSCSDRDLQRLIGRYGGLCAYDCGRQANTIDHVIPLTRGGTNYIGNLLPACFSCNSSKKDRLLIEWRSAA